MNKIKDKKIRAHKIAFMTHQDMKPEHWKELLEAKKVRDSNKYAPKFTLIQTRLLVVSVSRTDAVTINSKRAQRMSR